MLLAGLATTSVASLATPQINLEFVTLAHDPARCESSTKGLAVFEGANYRFVETVVG